MKLLLTLRSVLLKCEEFQPLHINTSARLPSPGCFYLLAYSQLQPAFNDFTDKMRQPLTMVPHALCPQWCHPQKKMSLTPLEENIVPLPSLGNRMSIKRYLWVQISRLYSGNYITHLHMENSLLWFNYERRIKVSRKFGNPLYDTL